MVWKRGGIFVDGCCGNIRVVVGVRFGGLGWEWGGMGWDGMG